MVYFSPAVPGDLQGTIWQIPLSAARPGGSSTASAVAMSVQTAGLPCFRLAGKRGRTGHGPAEGADVRVIARFAERVSTQVPAVVSRREMDRLPARRWRPVGYLRRELNEAIRVN